MIKQKLKDFCRKFNVSLKSIPPKGPYGVESLEDIRRIICKDSRPDLILDVGANEGQSAIEFSRIFPDVRIHSFEPTSQAFDILIKDTKQLPNVTCFKKALGTENTVEQIHIHNDTAMNSLLEYNYDYGQEVGLEEVTVITLDSHIEGNNIKAIDLLKIDTQGYDLEVLKGAAKALESNIIHLVYAETNFVEMYNGQASFEEIYSFMIKYGFKLTGLYGNVYRENDFIQWSNALFVNPAFVSRSSS